LLWIISYHSINSQDLPMILLLQELRKILELDLENSHSHWNFWFILFFSIILQYKFFYLDNQRKFLEHRSVNLNLLILICVWMFMKNSNNESPCHHLKIWILYLPFTYFSHFFLDFVLSFLLAKQLNYGWLLIHLNFNCSNLKISQKLAGFFLLIHQDLFFRFQNQLLKLDLYHRWLRKQKRAFYF
jgi:hypothetical protein